MIDSMIMLQSEMQLWLDQWKWYSILMTESFPKPYNTFSGNVEDELDLCNCAIKTYVIKTKDVE